MKSVVLVWLETTMVWDGQPWAADLGDRPGLVPTTTARAAVWKHKATDEDIAKARAYAATEERCTVHIIAASERDPLGVAKRQAPSGNV